MDLGVEGRSGTDPAPAEPVGEGESGCSAAGRGVPDGVDLMDGFGEVPVDASPMANLARSLSSNVTRERAPGVSLGGLLGPGLPER